MTFKNLILLLFFIAFNFYAFAQIDAEVSFNEINFCGVNSSLILQDVSVGAVVTFRSWVVDGPSGFTQFNGANSSETVILTEVGLYTIRLTVCDATGDCNTHFYTDFVEVKNKPILSLNVSSYCVDNQNVFEAITLPNSLSIDSFYWDFGEGAGIVNGASTEIYSFNTIGPKTIRLEALAANGCRDTIIQNITAFDKPTAIITVSDSQVCIGNTVNFSGANSSSNTAGISYAWDTDFNTGIDNNNVSFISFPSSDLIAMLEVIDDNGCVDTAFQSLTVITGPDINFSADPQCANNIFNLEANIIDNGGSPIDSIYWYIDSMNYLTGENVSYNHPNKDSIPIILFAINEEGCPDVFLQYIEIDTLPDAQIAQNDTILCIGDSLDLTAVGDVEILWLPDSTSENTLTVSPTEASLYTLVGISENGACPNSMVDILVDILVEPEYIFDLSSNNPGIGTPVFIDFDYEPSFSTEDSILWLNSGTNNVLEYEYGNENNFIAREKESFSLQLTYNKDETKCVFETSVEVDVNENCSTDNFYVPNAFSPNDDEQNDNLIVKGYSIDRIESFVIFDRFGKEMFIADNIEFKNGVAQFGWDGRSKNGTKCNTGVYVYFYKTICINGQEAEGSGNITLFR